MWAYIARRLIQAVFILFFITMLCFILTRLSSDPMSQYANKPGMTAADREAIKKSLGLDKPVPVQYVRWLTLAAQGNLGDSFFSKQPVLKMIQQRLPLTLILMFTAEVVIIIVSLLQVIRTIVSVLLMDALNPLDHAVFQAVFGMIMTLLIAMEFLHSVVRMAVRGDSLVQVKTVLLIGLLALARKFIILDPSETSPEKIAALGGATLALGAVYWLLRERDDRMAARMLTARPDGAPDKNGG